MNRLSLLVGITVLVLTAVFFAGKWMFLGDLERRIDQETMSGTTLEAELEDLTRQHASLKVLVASAPVRTAPRFLAAGDEGNLVRRVFDAASQSGIVLREVELLASFHVKGKQEESGHQPQAFRTGEQLPQIDERTGMPVGAETDEEETEWPGTEVLPARLRLKGTWRSLVGFFDTLRRTAPLFQVRSTELDLESSGIVKGGAVLVFPIFEPTLAAPQAAGH